MFLVDIGIGEGFDIFQLLIRKQKNSTVKQTKNKQLNLTAYRYKNENVFCVKLRLVQTSRTKKQKQNLFFMLFSERRRAVQIKYSTHKERGHSQAV